MLHKFIYSSQPDTLLSDIYGRGLIQLFLYTLWATEWENDTLDVPVITKSTWLHKFLYVQTICKWRHIVSDKLKVQKSGSPAFWWSELNSRCWWLLATTDRPIVTLIKKYALLTGVNARWQWYCRCKRQRWLMKMICQQLRLILQWTLCLCNRCQYLCVGTNRRRQLRLRVWINNERLDC